MDDHELFARAAVHGDRVAIVDNAGARTYRELLERSAGVAERLRSLCEASAPHPRIAYLVGAGFNHAAVQWGIWRAGAIGVPISSVQAPAEWAYVVADSEAGIAVADASIAPSLAEAAASVRVVTTEELMAYGGRASKAAARGSPTSQGVDTAEETLWGKDDGALILYTSGTTGRPKGVVLTHANVEAQVRCLVAAWEWRADDRILHVLPLNHVHGIVNVLTCALWAGASCEMLPRFEAAAVWNVIAAGRVTLFMAVPTVYARLIAEWESASTAAASRLLRSAAWLMMAAARSAASVRAAASARCVASYSRSSSRAASSARSRFRRARRSSASRRAKASRASISRSTAMMVVRMSCAMTVPVPPPRSVQKQPEQVEQT